jgi:hypothetical protein
MIFSENRDPLFRIMLYGQRALRETRPQGRKVEASMSTPAPQDCKLEGLDLYAPRRSRTSAASEAEVSQSQSPPSAPPSDQPNGQENVEPAADAVSMQAAEARVDDAIQAAIEIARRGPQPQASTATLPPVANLSLPRLDTASRSLPVTERFDRLPAEMPLPRRSRLEPEMVPEPPISMQRRIGAPLLVQYAVVAAFAAVAAYVLAVIFSSQPHSGQSVAKNDVGAIAFGPADNLAMAKAADDSATLSDNSANPADNATKLSDISTAPPVPQAPVRLVAEDQRTFANEPLSLGISVDGAAERDSLLLAGLTVGTRVSIGLPVSQSSWQLPLHDLNDAVLYAPKDFIGVMNTAIDLLSPEKKLMDSRAVRFEWIAKQPRPTMAVPRVASGNPNVAPVQPIDQERAALLMKRGEDLLNTGDIAGARLAFKHLADAGNSEAALALGATFDPSYLAAHNVIGVVGDPATARAWYQRAIDLGSADAKRLLAQLAAK